MAGTVYTVLGIRVMILMNAISFIICAILECFMELKTEKSERIKKSFYKEFIIDFKEGVFFIYNNILLRYIIILLFFINCIVSAILQIGIPYIYKLIFKVSDFQFGLAQSVTVVGTLLGSIMVSFLISKMKLETLFNNVVKLCSVVLILIAIVTSHQVINFISNRLINFSLLVMIMFIFSVITTLLNISLGTLVQKLTPNNMLGRVMSAGGTACYIAIPLGQIIYGRLFDSIEVYIIYLVSGIIVAILSLISSKKINYKQNDKINIERIKNI